MNISPNRLHLPEMWQLYNLLKQGLEGTEKEYLIDTVSGMLDKLTQHEFISALQLMYQTTNLRKLNPIEMTLMFVAGLKKNDFFIFVDFIKGLNYGGS